MLLYYYFTKTIPKCCQERSETIVFPFWHTLLAVSNAKVENKPIGFTLFGKGN
jgi:hypothetical protein